MLESLQYVSIIIEALVAILSIFIIFQKKKIYGIGIFTTFLIYVFYDYVKLKEIAIRPDILYSLFFIATLSILLSVWLIYREGGK